jgi:hypothetical protein
MKLHYMGKFNLDPNTLPQADTVTDDINSDGLYNAFKKLGLI